jgi:hypothetical protein
MRIKCVVRIMRIKCDEIETFFIQSGYMYISV